MTDVLNTNSPNFLGGKNVINLVTIGAIGFVIFKLYKKA
jgi:hypothetical protein